MPEKLAFGGPFRQMLKKCLRPGRKLPARLCRAQAADKVWVQGPPRLVNHSRFPDGCAHGFAAPLRVALRFAQHSTEHALPFGAPKPYAAAFLRASEGRKKRSSPHHQGFFNGLRPAKPGDMDSFSEGAQVFRAFP